MGRTGPVLLALGAMLVVSCAPAGDAFVVGASGLPTATPTPTSVPAAPTTPSPTTSTLAARLDDEDVLVEPVSPVAPSAPAPSASPAPTQVTAAPTPAVPAQGVPPALPSPQSVVPVPTAAPAAPLPQAPVAQPVAPPAQPPGVAARLQARPCRVALLADSVGHDLILNGFGANLAGVGCPISWSRVQRGSPLSAGVAGLRAAGGANADVIVVLQGYSKAVSGRSAFPGLVDQVLQIANGRTVVWTLYGRTLDCSTGYQAALAQFNQWLQGATGRWSNLRLVNYPSVINAHPEYSQQRCPHLLASGSRAVAAWFASEVRRLVNTR